MDGARLVDLWGRNLKALSIPGVNLTVCRVYVLEKSGIMYNRCARGGGKEMKVGSRGNNRLSSKVLIRESRTMVYGTG